MRKKPDRIVDIPEDLIRELFKLPDRKTYSGLPDYALFALFLHTGIRPSECFQLLPGDFNFKTRTLICFRRMGMCLGKTKIGFTEPVGHSVVITLIQAKRCHDLCLSTSVMVTPT